MTRCHAVADRYEKVYGALEARCRRVMLHLRVFQALCARLLLLAFAKTSIGVRVEHVTHHAIDERFVVGDAFSLCEHRLKHTNRNKETLRAYTQSVSQCSTTWHFSTYFFINKSRSDLNSNFDSTVTFFGVSVNIFRSVVCVCVSQWKKKVPDEWQAQQAIPAILQVSISKHNAKKITTRVRGPFHQSITAILTEEKREEGLLNLHMLQSTCFGT